MRNTESGFTLIEAMTAILVLLFGLMAISNLFVTATTSNSIANAATAAAATAAQQIETLKAMPYTTLAAGIGPGVTVGNLAADVAGCPGLGGNCFSYISVPGAGTMHTTWTITGVPGTVVNGPEELFITVRSESNAVIGAQRSRAEFTTFRACVDTTTSCP